MNKIAVVGASIALMMAGSAMASISTSDKLTFTADVPHVCGIKTNDDTGGIQFSDQKTNDEAIVTLTDNQGNGAPIFEIKITDATGIPVGDLYPVVGGSKMTAPTTYQDGQQMTIKLATDKSIADYTFGAKLAHATIKVTCN